MSAIFRYLLLLSAVGLLGGLVWLKAMRPSPRGDVLESPAPAKTVEVDAEKLPGSGSTPVAFRPQARVNPDSPATLITRLLNGEDIPRPGSAELEGFLDANGRRAGSLLGAFRATGDRNFLREAMEKAPSDPRVAFAAYWFGTTAKYDEPASPERRQWLENLKQSDPNDSLGNFLSARDYFNAGQPDKALAELSAASGKTAYRDYSREFIQDAEEAYRAAGLSEAEAKVIACSELPLPHLAQLKKLAQGVVNLAGTYRQAGDEASAQAVLQLGLNVSQRLRSGGDQSLIQDLVGIATERIVLDGLDPAAAFGADGQTVKGRLDQMLQEREQIKASAKQIETMLPTMSEQDLVTFFDRTKTLGESAAMRWALEKYRQPGR